eukprot:GHVL01013571.1.p1 GENE.GHVL01013571.1~~GHVL01013571.1.p1  ORF type:complete len:283 (-),score=81.97 GHVL01013571.1:1620-2468(-)
MTEDDHFDVHLEHLLGVDLTPIYREEQVQEATKRNIQLLIEKTCQLPKHNTPVGAVVTLPTANRSLDSFSLPREKPIPAQTAKTRWDRFAEAKNITKRKRSRLVWDDIAQDWRPRWGYKSAAKLKEAAETAIIELKPGQTDPLLERSQEKQLSKIKQKKRQLRNQMEATGKKLPPGVTNMALPANERKRGAANLSVVLQRAQRSTASFGRFDPTLENEAMKPPLKKRKKVADNSNINQEMKKYEKVANLITFKRKRVKEPCSIKPPPKSKKGKKVKTKSRKK